MDTLRMSTYDVSKMQWCPSGNSQVFIFTELVQNFITLVWAEKFGTCRNMGSMRLFFCINC